MSFQFLYQFLVYKFIIFAKQNFSMKHASLVVIILITLFNYSTFQSPPNETPTHWTEDTYTSNCKIIGTPKMVQNQTTIISLTDNLIYIKSRPMLLYVPGQYCIQMSFKYYILIENNDDVITTTLLIVLLSSTQYTKSTNSYMIENIYEFIDANGPYVLLKQTDLAGNVKLTLYYYDISGNGGQPLIQVDAISQNTYPNEIFKSIIMQDVVDSSLNNDPNFVGILSAIVSINTITFEAIVRQISSTSFGKQIYRFKVSNINSPIYTNLLLGLEISGSNFYTYVSPAINSGSPPYVYANDQTAIQTSSGLYYNHIVLPFTQSMMIATYDNNGQNGNIFFLLNDGATYALSLVNMKTTLNAPAGSLQYLTDQAYFIIEINLDPLASTFYIVWADNPNMNNFTFLNSLGDNKNSQIVSDFSNQPKISSFIISYGNDGGSFTSVLLIWIYTSTKIIKYALVASYYPNDVQSITINKMFDVELTGNLLINKAGSNFQITTNLLCVCQTTQLTQMICFYGTDACTFTVQTFSTYCTPH